jgi:hypothetical protein
LIELVRNCYGALAHLRFQDSQISRAAMAVQPYKRLPKRS